MNGYQINNVLPAEQAKQREIVNGVWVGRANIRSVRYPILDADGSVISYAIDPDYKSCTECAFDHRPTDEELQAMDDGKGDISDGEALNILLNGEQEGGSK